MRRSFLLFLLILLCCNSRAQRLQSPAGDSLGVLKTAPVVPKNFYAQHLAFFCKKELQLQKRTNLNLFFRLGSKDYVDYLEQKPAARKF